MFYIVVIIIAERTLLVVQKDIKFKVCFTNPITWRITINYSNYFSLWYYL